ncbi:MAG: glycosyltransferase family 2 protein, partial [Lutibacter sp.]
MNNSLVSICIPTFNGEQFIVEAMESAITQTYSNLEIVVSDDASKDNTLKLIELFKEKSKIPINIYHHKPKGIGANWNNCIKRANGEYIKFLFQDDVLEQTCVEEMINVFRKNKNVSLVASKRNFKIEEDNNYDVAKNWISWHGDLQRQLNLIFIESICLIDYRLFKHPLFLKSPINKIGEPTVVMFKKTLVNEIGYFNEEFNH